MKQKFLWLGALLFLSIQLNAAEPIRWGVVGGVNVSKPTASDYDERVGFHVGGKAEIKLSGKESGFYLSPALLFSLKGGEPMGYLEWGTLKKVDRVEHNYYLNLPVHIGYKHSFNRKVSLFGSVGPYAGMGLFGKFKQKSDGETEGSRNIYGSKGYLNRFDWGMSGQVGVEIIRKIQFSLGYELGLQNVAKSGSYKNRNFTVSVAYMF